MRRFLAVLHTRSLEFIRDRAALGWNFAFPFFLIIGFAFAFSGEGKPLYKIGLLGDSPAARAEHAFLRLRHIEFVAYEQEAQAVERVRTHRIQLLLDLKQNRYFLNEDNAQGYIAEQLLLGSEPGVFQKAAVTGKALRYVDWVLPGILSMNMMFSCLFGVGYVLVRYRKNGMLKRFKATPLTALEFLSAQVVSRLLLILVVSAIVFFGSKLLIGFEMKGSYLALLVLAALGALAMIALGLLTASSTGSEEFAGGLLNVLSWPMMFLSGVWFSLEGTPPLLQQAAQFLPLTHLVDGARAVMNDGAGLIEIAPHLAVLAGMTAVLMAISAKLFRWEAS
ncbi:MAG: ABC transporter permease [Gammaproteobacteria bacterium]|nr:ABC transporter permease [Gammaproteobacteria bacterium]